MYLWKQKCGHSVSSCGGVLSLIGHLKELETCIFQLGLKYKLNNGSFFTAKTPYSIFYSKSERANPRHRQSACDDPTCTYIYLWNTSYYFSSTSEVNFRVIYVSEKNFSFFIAQF